MWEPLLFLNSPTRDTGPIHPVLFFFPYSSSHHTWLCGDLSCPFQCPGSSTSVQPVHRDSCSFCRCILDAFPKRDKLYVLLLLHHLEIPMVIIVWCFKIYIYVYFWLRWVFVALHRLSLIVASEGSSALWLEGFSLQWLLLWSTGAWHRGFSIWNTWGLEQGSVVVACGLSCSTAYGIFLDKGSNPCPLHWQVCQSTYPLCHQGNPIIILKVIKYIYNFWVLNSHFKRNILARLVSTTRK